MDVGGVRIPEEPLLLLRRKKLPKVDVMVDVEAGRMLPGSDLLCTRRESSAASVGGEEEEGMGERGVRKLLKKDARAGGLFTVD